jgi:hypothetical protein
MRVFVFKKTGPDFFVMQVSGFSEHEEKSGNNGAAHTFFLNKSEVESIIRGSLSALGTILQGEGLKPIEYLNNHEFNNYTGEKV